MNPLPERIGLSLSGGGYRATAFHLGTLNKLHEMGLLQKTGVISTISGGSITGAYYCLNKDDYAKFSQTLYEGLQTKNVIKRVLLSFTFFKVVLLALFFLVPAVVLLFTSLAWFFPVLLVLFIMLLMKFQFSIFPVSDEIEKIYNKFFYNGKTLADLPADPQLVIGATNLQTARPFIFSKDRMGDSSYTFRKPPVLFKQADFPVARAVMASSCVPFAFTPIKIGKQFFADPADADQVHPLLVDGGVYDNQGIHKIMQKGEFACGYVITSDAGGGRTGELSFRNTISLLITTVDVFMARIKNAQMVTDVYDNAATTKKQVAYFSLAWSAENCIPGFISNLIKKQVPESVIKAHQLPDAWVEEPKKFQAEITDHLKTRIGYKDIVKPTQEEILIARKVGTNLTALTKQQVDCLMKQASCLAEVQVKLYCPSIINRA